MLFFQLVWQFVTWCHTRTCSWCIILVAHVHQQWPPTASTLCPISLWHKNAVISPSYGQSKTQNGPSSENFLTVGGFFESWYSEMQSNVSNAWRVLKCLQAFWLLKTAVYNYVSHITLAVYKTEFPDCNVTNIFLIAMWLTFFLTAIWLTEFQLCNPHYTGCI